MAFQGTTRTGKPVQVGDQVSVTAIVTAVTQQSGGALASGNLGGAANLTLQLQGCLDGPSDVVGGVQQGTYVYTLGSAPTTSRGGPTVGVYAADVTASQSL
jgi:hypothetical protein